MGIDINKVVQELNQITGNADSVMRRIGTIVFKHVATLEAKEQRSVVKDIKDAKGLNLDPSYVYRCYNMVRKAKEIKEDISNEAWKPQPNLTISHYFTVLSHKITPAIALTILMQASQEGLSVRETKERIKEYRIECKPEYLERRTIMQEIYNVLKNVKKNDDLRSVADIIGRLAKEKGWIK